MQKHKIAIISGTVGVIALSILFGTVLAAVYHERLKNYCYPNKNKESLVSDPSVEHESLSHNEGKPTDILKESKDENKTNEATEVKDENKTNEATEVKDENKTNEATEVKDENKTKETNESNKSSVAKEVKAQSGEKKQVTAQSGEKKQVTAQSGEKKQVTAQSGEKKESTEMINTPKSSVQQNKSSIPNQNVIGKVNEANKKMEEQKLIKPAKPSDTASSTQKNVPIMQTSAHKSDQLNESIHSKKLTQQHVDENVKDLPITQFFETTKVAENSTSIQLPGQPSQPELTQNIAPEATGLPIKAELDTTEESNSSSNSTPATMPVIDTKALLERTETLYKRFKNFNEALNVSDTKNLLKHFEHPDSMLFYLGYLITDSHIRQVSLEIIQSLIELNSVELSETITKVLTLLGKNGNKTKDISNDIFRYDELGKSLFSTDDNWIEDIKTIVSALKTDNEKNQSEKKTNLIKAVQNFQMTLEEINIIRQQTHNPTHLSNQPKHEMIASGPGVRREYYANLNIDAGIAIWMGPLFKITEQVDMLVDTENIDNETLKKLNGLSKNLMDLLEEVFDNYFPAIYKVDDDDDTAHEFHKEMKQFVELIAKTRLSKNIISPKNMFKLTKSFLNVILCLYLKYTEEKKFPETDKRFLVSQILKPMIFAFKDNTNKTKSDIEESDALKIQS